ncbi:MULTISPECIES: zinc finger protein [Saccharopolyspora]|uniref:Zinc finger protein n=1 Tax=Saccharopolyspora cebuensis TaxID=418759 RepID=A0ABV4CMV3_9PSEU
MNYRPYPFSWAPGAALRHATAVAEWRLREHVTTLCGEVVEPVNTTLAWLWPTCAPCDVEAHRIAGAPMPRRRAAGAR